MASTVSPQTVAESPQEPQPSLPDKRRRWEDLGLVLFIGFLPLVVSAVYQWISPPTGSIGSTTLRFSVALLHSGGTLLLFVVLLRRQGRRLSDIGLTFQWRDLLRGAGLVAGTWFVSMLVGTYIGLIYFWSGWQPNFRDPDTIFKGVSPGLLLIYSVAAPFFEETLVRGYLMTELIGLSWPVWLATLASIVLQTSYHLYYGFAGALVVGAGFAISAIYFAKSRRLTPVIVSHLLWNLMASYIHWHH